MIFRRLLVVCCLLPLASPAACSSENANENEGAPPAGSRSADGTPIAASTSACSTGPAYDAQRLPPRGVGVGAGNLPTCTPRCGAEEKLHHGTYGTMFQLAALPSGACTSLGERCAMSAPTATATCDGVTGPCNLSAFECECAGGTWQCVLTSQGAGTCAPCNRDASTD